LIRVGAVAQLLLGGREAGQQFAELVGATER
jgi:hypothetical protein